MFGNRFDRRAALRAHYDAIYPFCLRLSRRDRTMVNLGEPLPEIENWLNKMCQGEYLYMPGFDYTDSMGHPAHSSLNFIWFKDGRDAMAFKLVWK